MYTVISDYFATGEGRTIMVLYTKAYPFGKDWQDPTKDGAYWALEDFKQKFGDYYAIGAEVKEGLVFDFLNSELVINKELRDFLIKSEKEAGGLEYFASLHFNYS
jgi:hypothetical protein